MTLDDVSTNELRAELRRVEAKKPALRLVVALNYKHGLTQTEIAEQYGVTRKTVYNWLERIENRPLAEAIRDDDRPGRPSKLSSDQQRRLDGLLQDSPGDHGYEDDRWRPTVVRQLVADEFGVEYSVAHVRRLLAE